MQEGGDGARLGRVKQPTSWDGWVLGGWGVWGGGVGGLSRTGSQNWQSECVCGG